MSLRYLLIVIIYLALTACAATEYNGYNRHNGMARTASSGQEQDDPYSRGMRYLLGQGVEQDYGKAKNLLEDAASQNNPYAENELGYMHMAGLGVDQDYTKAFTWYQRAADHGLSSAQYSLGTLYAKGLGTPVDMEKAQIWFKKAAASGFSPARVALT